MSALIQHLVRRGMVEAHKHFRHGPSPERMEMLQHDAELYEKMGREIKPVEFLPIVITVAFFLLLIASVRYTIGDVMASLAMIESSSSTTLVEPKPPAYTEEEQLPVYAAEVDAPLEKEVLLKPADRDADVEVTVIQHKPITNRITTTMGLLHRVGGFRARWRGLGISVLYHILHAVTANFFASIMGFGGLAHIVGYITASLMLARLHMAWTHSMITQPNGKTWWRQMVPHRECKRLFLPVLFVSLAQQATVLLPIGVAFALGAHEVSHEAIREGMKHGGCGKQALLGLRFLAVPATALFVALAVLLPATVTLTRIEATLLPEDRETIVPFDKEAVMGDVDVTVRGGCKALFVQAWRSFDRSSRKRLVGLYAKMILVQVTLMVIGVHFVVAELYLLGPERLVTFFKSARAQIKLMMIEAHSHGSVVGAVQQ